MKTMTFLLLSFALSLSLSATNPPVYDPQVIDISLDMAIKDPALVQTMYLQLEDDFLKAEPTEAKIIKTVFYNYSYYRISGTYEEWISFFLMDPVLFNTSQSPIYFNQ